MNLFGKTFGLLWDHIPIRRRVQFGLLGVLMLLASLAEIFSIGAVLPFLSVLTNPGQVYELRWAKYLINWLGITSPSQLLLPITIIFGLASLISGAFRMLLLWVSTRLSYSVGADLSIAIYRNTLYQPYSVHLSRNSSEIIAGITNKAGVVIGAISSTLILMGSSMIALGILITMLIISPTVAFAAFGVLGSFYMAIIVLTRKRQRFYSYVIARESTLLIKSLQEGLGGIRDILIDGTQEIYCQIYRNADIALRKAEGNNQFISQSPRYGIEALGMVLIGSLAYTMTLQNNSIPTAIPILGALALGAQRLLPVLQQAYQSWSSIRGNQASLIDALMLLSQPAPSLLNAPTNEPIEFKQKIELNRLGFRYSSHTPWVIKEIDLKIPKGGRIGLIGKTGSGKSTLLDIIMGLLYCTDGNLLVDETPITQLNYRSWQSHLAHVPQAIYLSDGTIEENIAFGVPKDQIDFERVRQAAKKAQISQTIEGLENNYQTKVGERGIRLSGGQRQRIGIARALYKKADVIILDEATSALDGETEQDVMNSINSLSNDLTLIIVAHRMATLKSCTMIVELSETGLRHINSYEEIAKRGANY